MAEKLSDFSINFKSSATLAKQVEERDALIQELREQLVDYEQMKNQNELYREFLELKEENPDYKFSEAAVIGRDAANSLSTMVLNKGSTDEVSVNEPVSYGK